MNRKIAKVTTRAMICALVSMPPAGRVVLGLGRRFLLGALSGWPDGERPSSR